MDQARIDREISSCYHTSATRVLGLNIQLCNSCLDTEHMRLHEREIFLRKMTDAMFNEIMARKPRPPVTYCPPGPMPGTRVKSTKPKSPGRNVPVPKNAKQRAAYNNLAALGIV